MNIEAKPPQRILAEAAAFTEQIPNTVVRFETQKRLGDTAMSLVSGEPVVVAETLMGRSIEYQVKPDDYIDFLRSADEDTRADIGFVTDMMTHFDDSFATEVHAHFDKVDTDVDGAQSHDSFLGKGANGSAFRISKDGQDYAVKRGGFSFRDVRAFRLADHIDGVSHLVAADLESGLAVMNLVKGKEANKMTAEDLEQVTDDQVAGVVQKTLDLYAIGIGVDPKPSNFLYDKAEGYSIIDYHARPETNKLKPADYVFYLKDMLGGHIADAPEGGSDTPEYAEFQHQNSLKTVKKNNRFLDVLEKNFPELIQQAAEIQRDRNQDTRYRGNNGIMGNTRYMRHDDPTIKAYEERIQRLGLEGTQPVNNDHLDAEVVDGPDIVIKNW